MRALVVSGGGAKGAFGGGVAQYLIEDLETEYDMYLGTSTGSLLVPLLALKKLDRLKEAYTSVTQEDIFTVNPFKVVQNKNGVTKVEINLWNVFKNIVLREQNTFGDSSNLRLLIEKFITHDAYKELLETNKDVICCTVNATLGDKEYKSCKNYEWEDFCDWLYASACAPPFMSLVEKNGYEYTDGGVLEHAPIQEAIDRGAKEIDVIILRTEEGNYKIEKIRNIFHWLIKLGDLQTREIGNDDIQIAKLRAMDEEVKLNIYYTPRVLTNNSLIFDKEIMNNWWTEGYEHAKAGGKKTYSLVKGRKPKLMKNKDAED